jgi:hypothetical protein
MPPWAPFTGDCQTRVLRLLILVYIANLEKGFVMPFVALLGYLCYYILGMVIIE